MEQPRDQENQLIPISGKGKPNNVAPEKSHLIVDKDCEEAKTCLNPERLRWFRDEEYRRRSEATKLAAQWGLSMRMVPKVDAWLKEKTLTAIQEIPVRFKDMAAARRSFVLYMTKQPHKYR